jgi:AraC-like DNA-binding protein
MSFQTLRPSPLLADAIQVFWIYQGQTPAHAFERVLPMGREEILINLSDGELRCYEEDGRLHRRTPGPILTGMHRSSYIIDTRQQSAIMGVHFKPGGVWKLLGIPANELSDARVEMQALFGEDACRLMDRLMHVTSPGQRLRIVDAVLSARRFKSLHPAVAWAAGQISRYPAQSRITLLADEAGLSMRRFSELFTVQVGVSPKRFARLKRFHTTLHRIHSAQAPDWCDIASRMGYADQAHMIREFREFSGLAPSAYHTRRGAFPHLVRTTAV